MPRVTRELKPQLYGWQIFFIAISAVIGGGIFSHNGEALEIAGPAGMLVIMGIMGLVAIAVMEGLSELTQLFPAPNAIVEYVRVFVDKDLAWVVGIAYWYTYASIFATQNLAAATLVSYWGWSQRLQIGVFYCAAPLAILLINYASVQLYGWIEFLGGLLKIALVIATSITLFVIAGNDNGVDEYRGPGAINDGFRANTDYTKNYWTAMCWVAPVVAYSFVGVETVTIAAFEARVPDRRRSRIISFMEDPSKFIAYVAFVLYMVCTVSETLNVKWTNPSLPLIYGGIQSGNTINSVNNRTQTVPSSSPTSSMVVIAMLQSNHHRLADLLNACLVFSVLSAGNTSLYIASRTLYGLTRQIPPSNRFASALYSISHVERITHVPVAALSISFIAFFWLPFITLAGNSTGQKLPDTALLVFEVIAASASVSCMLVWATLCIAFIRYQIWINKFKDFDESEWPSKWKRDDDAYEAFTLFGSLQPIPAYFGLVGCIVIVAFASATWWNTPATVSKVLSAFLAPIIFILVFVSLKILHYYRILPRSDTKPRWVSLTTEVTELDGAFHYLRSRRQQQVEANLEDRPNDDTHTTTTRPTTSAHGVNSMDLQRLPTADTAFTDSQSPQHELNDENHHGNTPHRLTASDLSRLDDHR